MKTTLSRLVIGVLYESFAHLFRNMKVFLKNMPSKEEDAWKKQTGKTVNESLTNALIEHVGRPLAQLLSYLEKEHVLHCRPNNVGAGGLSGLPTDFIYYNATANKSMKTTKKLPIPDASGKFPTILNGNKSYELILGYFTTKDLHPNKVHQLGWKMLKKLYPKIQDVARQVTRISKTSKAETAFQARLKNRTLSYFNENEIPENQTTGSAFKLCKSVETAKKYCPDRWAAMEKWLDMARKVMAMLGPKTVSMFYFLGDKRTTPNCPVKLKPNFNPAFAAQTYTLSKYCTSPSVYSIPFFLKDVGPKFTEYTINAHEARPGHHIQIQGRLENFKDKCGGVLKWLDDQTSYTAFIEGWALYAENPLTAKQTDMYEDNPMQQFGMLKWQVWRALRLIVDTGLHHKGMTRQQAKDLFARYAWDDTDIADKEITRYLSIPGQATAYMIGQLDIWSLRNKTQQKLGAKFSLKDFHYQVLSQGSSPLSYLQSHIDRYIACTLSPKKEGCDLILNPPKSSDSSSANLANEVYDSGLDRMAPMETYLL